MLKTALSAALLALTLAACATPVPLAGSGQTGIVAAATLAPWGSWEAELAPAYTRNAIARQAAARALGKGRIDVGTARRVLAATDAARAALDDARRARHTDDGLAHLAAARKRIAAAENLLETPR